MSPFLPEFLRWLTVTHPLRAGLVVRAGQWRWSSLWQRSHGNEPAWLSAWPVAMPEN